MYKHLPGEPKVRFDSARCVDNADIIMKRFSQLRRLYRIPIRVPKSCRIHVAEAEAEAEWNCLVFFPIHALGIPVSPNTTGSSLTSIIRANLRCLTRTPTDLDTLCQQLPCHHASKDTLSSVNLRSLINSRLMLIYVMAAIRVMASDDTVLRVTPEVLQSLKQRHPPETEDSLARWYSPGSGRQRVSPCSGESGLPRRFKRIFIRVIIDPTRLFSQWRCGSGGPCRTQIYQ